MAEYVAYRCCAHRSPFWQEPNPGPGRYNRASEAPTTYLGLHPLTPWAELLRATDRREPDAVQAFRPVSWAVRIIVEPHQVIELNFDNAVDYGLEPEDLVDDDHGPCQAFAAGLRADDEDVPRVIIAPSAALPGTRSIILVGPRVIAPYELEPNFDPLVDTSAAATAALGASLLGLVPWVHYARTGVAHPGLEHWRQGQTYDFVEPNVSERDFYVG